jgi:hypothetical protein
MAIVPDWLNATFTVRIAYDVAYMSCGWSRDTESQFVAAAREVLDKVIDRALEAARARRRESYETTHYAHASSLEYRVTSSIYSVVLEYLRFTPDSPDPNDGERIGNPIEGFSFEVHGSDKRFDTKMILGAWPRNPNVVINQINPFSCRGDSYTLSKTNIERNGYSNITITRSEQSMFAHCRHYSAFFGQQAFFNQRNERNIDFASLHPTIESIDQQNIFWRADCIDNPARSRQLVLFAASALATRPRPDCDIRDTAITHEYAPPGCSYSRDQKPARAMAWASYLRMSGLPPLGAWQSH